MERKNKQEKIAQKHAKCLKCNKSKEDGQNVRS